MSDSDNIETSDGQTTSNPQGDEFSGMTIEQIQREMRKRRANDESKREHISLFGGAATSHSFGHNELVTETDNGWAPGGADAIGDVDVTSTDHAPRTILPQDAGTYQPVQLFQGAKGQASSPGPAPWQSPPTVAPPQYAPQAAPPTWQPAPALPKQFTQPTPAAQSQGWQPNAGAEMPSSVPTNRPTPSTWPSGSAAPPPVAPPMNWSPAPNITPGQPAPQTYGEARKQLYGTSDDPFKNLPEHRQSSVDAYAKAGKIILWGGSAVAVALVAWLIYTLIPFPVSPPTSFTNYVSPDQQFMLSAPTGWTITRSGSASSKIPNCETTIKSGAAKVDVELVDLQQQATNMMLNSGYYSGNALTDPSGLLHFTTPWRGSNTHQAYKEKYSQLMDSNFGPMDYSEFTGKGGLFGWGGPMHGYRATVYGNRVGILVLVECPESSWVAMQPSFMRILKSVGAADGSVYTPPTDDTSPSGSANGSGTNPAGSTNGADGSGGMPTDGSATSEPSTGVPTTVTVPGGGGM